MSLSTLTRSSFQNGIPPTQVRLCRTQAHVCSNLIFEKWLGLCRLCISNEDTNMSSEKFGNILSSGVGLLFLIVHITEIRTSDSVISLFRSYPGHVGLQGYLEYAICEGTLNVAVYTSVFLQAARSPELQEAATLELLCRITLDAHYSSGLASPIGSVVSYAESPIVVLGMIHDALSLLRTAYSLPASHSRQLVSSAGELVILLLACVTDTSQISIAQATINWSDVNDVLHNYNLRLSTNVRQGLETFAMTLSLICGDNAKVVREAQLFQSMLAMTKSDIAGSTAGTDSITCSLLLHNLVSLISSVTFL